MTRRSWVRENRKMPFRMFKKDGTEIVPVFLDKEGEDEFINEWEIFEEIVRDIYYLSVCHGANVDIGTLLEAFGLEGSRDKMKEIIKIYGKK